MRASSSREQTIEVKQFYDDKPLAAGGSDDSAADDDTYEHHDAPAAKRNERRLPPPTRRASSPSPVRSTSVEIKEEPTRTDSAMSASSSTQLRILPPAFDFLASDDDLAQMAMHPKPRVLGVQDSKQRGPTRTKPPPRLHKDYLAPFGDDSDARAKKRARLPGMLVNTLETALTAVAAMPATSSSSTSSKYASSKPEPPSNCSERTIFCISSSKQLSEWARYCRIRDVRKEDHDQAS